MTLFLPIVTMFRNVALFLIVNGVFFRWKLAFIGNVGTDKRKLSSAKLLIQAGRFFKCTPSFFCMQLKIHPFIPFQIWACSQSIYSQCQFVGIHMSRRWEPRVVMWLVLVLWANGTLCAGSEAGLGFTFHSFQ